MTWQTDPPIFPDFRSIVTALLMAGAVVVLLLISRSAF